jgi:hypothetical protein
MSALKTDRGKANTAIPVRKEASAVRFSARSTWISPKMTSSSFGRLFVSILIVFNVIDSAQTLVDPWNRLIPSARLPRSLFSESGL